MTHADLSVYFDVVFKHTPATALIGLTTIKKHMTHTRYYPMHKQDQLLATIEKLADSTNIYMRITPLGVEPPMSKRGLERDSLGSSVLWVDLDCYDDKQMGIDALRGAERPPTLIIDSGGGLHAYWLLNRFETSLGAVKGRNKALYLDYSHVDSDACFDLSRILRVPSTYNLKYDPPRHAVVVHYDPNLIYRLEDFSEAPIEDEPIIHTWDSAPLPGSFAAVLAETDRKLYSYMTDANKAAKMFSDQNGILDRSANDAYCITRLLSLGYSPEQCMSVLTDARYTTSLKYRDTGRYNYVTLTVNNMYSHFVNSPAPYFNKSRFQAKTMAETLTGTNQQYIYTAESYYHYENGYYARGAETLIKAEVVRRLGDRWNKHCEDEVLAYIQSANYVPIEQCNVRSGEYMNVRNGMLSLRTGELEPHDQKFRNLYQIPANYLPTCDTAFVDWFVESILPKDAIPFLWEYLGSCLITNHYAPKAFLILIGLGDSGKSTMLRFIRSILGESNCAAINLQMLADNRFASVKLYGKLANIFADLDETEAGNVGQIKSLTGDDTIAVEEKFQRGFDFKPTARLIFSANNYPTIKNADEAYFNRVKLIRCPNSFKGKKADTTLSDRLAQPENLSAALLRMYQGLQRLLAQGDFTQSASMATEHANYQTYADSVIGFLQQCRYHAMYQTPKQTLYKAYSEACKFAHQSSVTEKSFYRRVNDYMSKFGIGEARPEINDQRVWCYTGIKPPTDVATMYIVGQPTLKVN